MFQTTEDSPYVMEPVSESHSVVADSLWPHRLYSPRNSPGQNTGVGSLSLLLGIFPAQGSNSGLPHCRQIIYQLSHKGGPMTFLNGAMELFKLGNPPGSQETWLISFYAPQVSCLLQPKFALSLSPGITSCVALSDSCLSFWAVNNTDFCFSCMQVSVCCVPPSKESWNLMKQRGVYVLA